MAVALALVASIVVAVPPTGAAPDTADAAAATASGAEAWTTPTRPPDCSQDRALSGDVAGCIVTARGDPARRGWGVAPDPSSTPGFRFAGWAYTGPGVDEFAARYTTTNHAPVAGLQPGRLRTHVAAAPLIEGFLDEIHRRGYPVDGATSFVYRCTSGSGGNCTSGSMSNHAWGLAVDINAGANPERTYHADDDTSACAVPQQTDIPRWVVETAERWGLFWGGYGWRSGGCFSPTDWSDSVRRDPHHFEFRGSVEMALAIAAQNGAGRNDDGGPAMGCHTIVNDRRDEILTCTTTGVPDAGTRSPVHLDPPPGAVAAVLNITAVGASASGFLTAESCRAPLDAERTTSNTNVAVGQAASNTAIVDLDGSDQVCVWRSSPMHTVVDVVGYLVEDGNDGDGDAALRIRPVDPRRAADTRASGRCAAVRDGETTDCHGRPWGKGPIHTYPLDAPHGAIVNVTAVSSPAGGFVTADRCSAFAGGEPATSTVNHATGEARANLSIVASDTTGGEPASCLWTSAGADLIVDVAAVLDPEEGLAVQARPATRLLDTRACGTGPCAAPAPGSVVEVPESAGGAGSTGGAVVNVTVTGASAPGYVTADECGRLDPARPPATSTVNVAAGTTAANLAVVTGGAVCLYTSTDGHLIVDRQASLVESGEAAGLHLVEPARRLDTRTPEP